MMPRLSQPFEFRVKRQICLFLGSLLAVNWKNDKPDFIFHPLSPRRTAVH